VLEIERSSFGRDAYPRDLFLELHRDCGPLFFVAKRARRIVGYAVTCEAGSAAEIVSIAVDSAHRQTGVATALLRHTMERLKRSGVRSLALMVRVANHEAIRLYERLGFCAAGSIPRYYEDRSDGLLMRREL
jgi:ribosomal-protein-alanine N-acetyltransferase